MFTTAELTVGPKVQRKVPSVLVVVTHTQTDRQTDTVTKD